MKNIKILILILVIALTSGCSVEYNLNINEDLSINEVVEASENTEVMQSKTGLIGDNAVNYLYDTFSNNSDADFTNIEENGVTIGTSNASYNSLEQYTKNFYSNLFEIKEIEIDDDVYTITINQIQKLSSTGSSTLLYDDVKVNIKIPFKVIDQNADEVSGNIYTWNIHKDADLKTIKFSFNKVQQKNAINLKVNNKNVNVKYSYIVIVSLVIVVGIVVIYLIIKNKKNNII